MEQTIHTITLDLQRPCNHGAVTVKKGDTHRTLRLRLLSGGRPYEITEDCYAVFTAQKPDGTVLYNSCTREGNTLLYRLTPQTTAAAGVLECEIKLYGPSDALITSAAFTLTVEDTVYTDGEEAITSTGEATALTQLITQANAGIAETKAVAEELLQAKEDGLFNGPQGEKGDKGDAEGAVLYLTQTLTKAQQAQARKNIGAMPEDLFDKVIVPAEEVLADGLVNGHVGADGALTDATTTQRTDYLPLYDYSKVELRVTGIISAAAAVNMHIARYDKDKNFIAAKTYTAFCPLNDDGTLDLSGTTHANLIKINTEAAFAHGMGIDLSASDYDDGTAYIVLYGVSSAAELTMRVVGRKEYINYTVPEKILPESNAVLAEKVVGLESDMEALLERVKALEIAAGLVKTITFTVDGEEYTAEEGMTWSEFVTSKYNKTLICKDCGNEYKGVWQSGETLEGTQKNLCDCSGYANICDEEMLAPVNATDTIIAGYAYTVA